MKHLMKTGTQLIAAERERQISVEGWTPDHDDEHRSGEMALAASCYALPIKAPYVTEEIKGVRGGMKVRVPFRWPWEPEWWKPTPKNRVRELVKAGALIAAEIDRLNRAALHPATKEGKA